ncbi:MAG: hypothetical protein WC428_01465 [Candidatus Paceibacterota bacterium]|jgi:hypothetical protein
MNRVKLTINIDSENELTEEQIVEAMVNMKFRLEGYSTPCPEFLKNAEIAIDKNYKITMLP